jgi:hypothetical protein
MCSNDELQGDENSERTRIEPAFGWLREYGGETGRSGSLNSSTV